jgi:hypothetical protein
MRRSQTPQPPRAVTKPPLVAFLEKAGALAERHSHLLVESKLWSEASRALAELAAGAGATAFVQGAAPGNADGVRKHLLNVAEAAKFLRLSDTTLNNWRLTGGGPEFVWLGRRIFYRLDVLEGFLLRQTFPHTSAYPREE